ncbi:MAG TPA: histone deacetylase [Methanomicrobia archaeon]|nr:histone deacetylase [Methanomicrobia archaeon]
MTRSTGFVYHADFLRHDTGVHPESADRLLSIMRKLEQQELITQLEHIVPERAPIEAVTYVHSREYVQKVADMSARGGGMLDPDTPVCAATFDTALLAAGGLMRAADSVLANDNALKRVFALVRPPGHHANAKRGRGFCIFNNIAIAAEYLKRAYRLKRILIVDWDVHHGNGTQEIFYEDPGVLYLSTHQYPHYPGTGWITEVGAGGGEGYTVNIPLPIGSGDAEYLFALTAILVPIAREFQPECVLVSAGFDTHSTDPLASMKVSTSGFGAFAELVLAIANEQCWGRVILTLEGGYNHEALGDSVLAVFQSLLAGTGALPESGGMRPSAEVQQRVADVLAVQRAYWRI